MLKFNVKTFKLGEDEKLNKWLDEHQHQIADKGGPYPMDVSGLVWIMYDPEKPKVEAPKETPTAPVVKAPDLEKQRAQMKAAAIIKKLQDRIRDGKNLIVEGNLTLRIEKKKSRGKKGGPDISEINNIKNGINNAKMMVKETEAFLAELEDGKFDDILEYDVDTPDIILPRA